MANPEITSHPELYVEKDGELELAFPQDVEIDGMIMQRGRAIELGLISPDDVPVEQDFYEDFVEDKLKGWRHRNHNRRQGRRG